MGVIPQQFLRFVVHDCRGLKLALVMKMNIGAVSSRTSRLCECIRQSPRQGVGELVTGKSIGSKPADR
jgi:hypothetical protein